MRMAKNTILVLALGAALLGLTAPTGAAPQKAVQAAPELSVQYEELTGPDFIKAAAKAEYTCLIPLGIMEKHGPHMPLGTDLFEARELALRAAHKEYTLVFPPYYIGQIFEAQHQPGTVAYSVSTMLTVLQETCDQLGRNGLKKIILVNGHGGNDQLVQYFCQSQLASRKPFVVYLFDPSDASSVHDTIDKLRQTKNDGHAGEEETSEMLAIRPDLVHLDRAKDQSGADQNRLSALKHAYTAMWWYAKYPNHYAGDGSFGRKDFGETVLDLESGLLAEMIKSVKQDKVTPKLQNEFFDAAEKPLQTKQSSK